jgi:site-specific recombinase
MYVFIAYITMLFFLSRYFHLTGTNKLTCFIEEKTVMVLIDVKLFDLSVVLHFLQGSFSFVLMFIDIYFLHTTVCVHQPMIKDNHFNS